MGAGKFDEAGLRFNLSAAFPRRTGLGGGRHHAPFFHYLYGAFVR